jgi:glyoxylase-like metal-dependent hydrolase (beta-lactamase superfamily II)
MINANHVLLMNICVAETNKIETINLWNDSLLLKGAQGVNSYLIATDTGFIMIDSGYSSRRKDLEIILENAGCKPGNLKLVISTHGDLDHIGDCAFLQSSGAVYLFVESLNFPGFSRMYFRMRDNSVSVRIIWS